MDLDHCPDCGKSSRQVADAMCRHQYGQYSVYYGMRMCNSHFIVVFRGHTLRDISNRVLRFTDRWFKLDEKRIERLLVLK